MLPFYKVIYSIIVINQFNLFLSTLWKENIWIKKSLVDCVCSEQGFFSYLGVTSGAGVSFKGDKIKNRKILHLAIKEPDQNHIGIVLPLISIIFHEMS